MPIFRVTVEVVKIQDFYVVAKDRVSAEAYAEDFEVDDYPKTSASGEELTLADCEYYDPEEPVWTEDTGQETTLAEAFADTAPSLPPWVHPDQLTLLPEFAERGANAGMAKPPSKMINRVREILEDRRLQAEEADLRSVPLQEFARLPK